jgi:antitoxin HigA-1
MTDVYDPPQPGEIIREDCLKPLGLSITAAPKWLGISRQSLSEGRNGVSAETAIRLEKAFGSTAETWLRLQLSYDLWRAKQKAAKIKVARYPVREPA